MFDVIEYPHPVLGMSSAPLLATTQEVFLPSWAFVPYEAFDDTFCVPTSLFSPGLEEGLRGQTLRGSSGLRAQDPRGPWVWLEGGRLEVRLERCGGGADILRTLEQ